MQALEGFAKYCLNAKWCNSLMVTVNSSQASLTRRSPSSMRIPAWRRFVGAGANGIRRDQFTMGFATSSGHADRGGEGLWWRRAHAR